MLPPWLAQVNGWEAAAVALGLAYLLLALRESIWCWHAAFLSTAIYLFLFWGVSLPMESALQVYYLVMAVYGWWHWRDGERRTAAPLPVRTWPLTTHAAAITGVLLASWVSGALITHYGSGRLPYLDSFTTWGAILTTWMVTQKLLENWLYWLVIDTVSMYLYLDRGLHLTAVLFALYLVIAVFGFFQWRRHYREQHAASVASSAD